MEGWTRPYRGRYEQCIIKPARPRMARLQMKDLYSAFILLGIGVGISFVTFLYSAIPLICNRIIEKFPTSENERKARETLFKGIHQGRLVRGVKKEKN